MVQKFMKQENNSKNTGKTAEAKNALNNFAQKNMSEGIMKAEAKAEVKTEDKKEVRPFSAPHGRIFSDDACEMDRKYAFMG